MLRTSNPSRSFWLTIILLTFIANLAAVWSSWLRWDELGVDLFRSVWGILAAAYLGMTAACLGLFVLIVRSGGSQVDRSPWFKFFQSGHLKVRLLGWITFLAILFLIPYVKFAFQVGRSGKDPLMDPALMSILYYWICWYALLLAMVGLKLALGTTWQAGFVSALVLLGVVFEILIRFNAVTAYPLSRGWSEGSRYYYASLYFSEWIYGEAVPLPTLHPSRYLLQSIPFLIPGLDITIHRLWQFLLWIGLTAGAAIALAKRAFSPQEKAARWLFIGGVCLFFLRVGIYYHLQVMVILLLLLVSGRRPWLSLMAVVLASLWAGISRVNWFPVPAMIAIALYLLETPLQPAEDHSKPITFKQVKTYLALPALWAGVGLLCALAAQTVYIFLSGNARNADAFASSFVSDLLWYRLWPNANHFLGILPAILIVSGPLIVTVLIAARRRGALHPLRWSGLFLIMVILFTGSLVVSVKIGGGGDLHNMDAYAILIAITAAYLVGGRVQVEPGEPQLKIRSWPALSLAVLIPVLFLILLLSPYPKYDQIKNENAYRQLVQAVNEMGEKGPVLFINERQLVTFGDVAVPLVADYEAVTLMEMAMSNNQAYLNRFYSDLQNHRFAAIVAAKQNRLIKQTGPLVEENNAWNSRVSPYLLCYYHPVLTVEPQGNRIEVYVPTTEVTQCP
ncbi:MAG: hypothetical protein JW730_13980 [Anaerolineales bacterium]|nr:hypothetical protein [Anaerolineales bacterium]